MKKPRVLIVEDESSIAELIAVNLRHNGFEPIWSEDGVSAQREIDAFLPDLILLDWMLPGQSGLQLARQWRKDPRTKSIPILMLTARGDEADQVLGLDLGADDYVTKPFSIRELLARVRALLRRTGSGKAVPDELRFEDVVVNFASYEASKGGKALEMTRKEFGVLRALAARAGEVVTRDELLNEVWGYENYPSTRTVDNHIASLRAKLEDDPAAPRRIHTVHGVGYKFSG